MSYTVTTTAGVTIASIADGTVNTSATSLTLIGKNYAGYGLFLNENYVKLLENFANTTEPLYARTGQLWYDSTNSVLKVYSGSLWKPISSSAAASSSPTGPVTGDLWWDTSNAQLKVWSGSAWVTIGPSYTTTAGTSGAVVETILDSSSISHVIVKFYISNSVIAILSKDSEFTPQTSITGFTTIKPGMNLISSTVLTGAQFTGSASNALQVGGIAGGSYLRNDQDTSTAYKITASGGVDVGNLAISSVTGTVGLVNSSNNSDLNLWVNKGGVSTKAIGIAGSTAIVTFVGNVVAPNFVGRAITASYADLAERFETDTPLLPGTVVELGGVKEITAAVQELSEAVFGVISTNAGFLMNGSAGDNVTHPPVAVNGRVPVRVIGTVTKGDRLVSAGSGLARAATRDEMTAFNVIGRALEDKTTTGEGTVEAIVKLNS
jgi:hypothetical protein